MKSLVEYIKGLNEACDNCEEKVITFNFTDLEGADDILKELATKDGCDVDEKELKVTVNTGNYDKLASVQEILQKYTQEIRTSVKRSENEAYAQKTVKFENKMNELNDTIQNFATPSEDNSEKEEKKEEKEDE